MTNIRMKAGDTIHISSVKADNIAPGEEFEVSTAVADDLESRGLASRVVEEKAAPAPANKAVKAAPTNKSKRAK